MSVPHLRLAAFERPPFRLPFRQPAIEQRDAMSAERRQHPPGAGSAVVTAIVVDYEPVAVAQSKRLHAAGELVRRRNSSIRSMMRSGSSKYGM